MEKRKQNKHTINWKKLSSSDLQKYGTEVTARLQEISIIYQDIPLKDKIDNMVKDLSEVLHLAAEAITRIKKPRPHTKHYWNSNISVSRKDIIFYRNICLEEGKLIIYRFFS